MATPVEIAVRAVGTAQAGRALGGLDSKTSRLGSTLKTVAKAGALALGAGAVYGAKKLIDFTQAAIEDEAAQSALAQTLKKTTGATDAQVKSVEKWITRQGRLLGVTDDELRPALQRMAEGTGSVAKAQRMVSLAMDVSAGTGKSLKAVTEALLRAQNGSVGGLSRYGIATKDAAGETLSLNKVLDGMREKFGGQAARHADTMAGKMERLKLVMSEAGESIGAKFLPLLSDMVPALTDAAIVVTNKVVPAVGDMVDWFKRNRGEIGSTVGAIKDGLLPPLQTLAHIAGEAAKFLAGLPAPVKSFGGEAAAAAIILPRMAGALTATTARMSALGGATAGTTSRMAALKGAARGAAGIGGMALLTAGAKTSNTALSTLANTGGAAMMGFAVGGPIGAAIGGSIGLLGTLWSKARAAHNAFDWYQDARVQVLDFKDALDATTGAMTRQAREMVLLGAKKDGIVNMATRMGIAQRDLVGAVNGNEGATRRLNRAYRENFDLLDGNEQVSFNTWLRRNTDQLADQRGEIADNNAALVPWSKALKGLPKDVRTAVRAIGVDATAGELRHLKKEYGLIDPQIQTIIKAIGTETAVRRVHGVWQVMDEGKRVKPNLDPWLQTFVGYMNRTDRVSHDFAFGKIPNTLRQGTQTARANLDPFTAGLATSLNGAAGRARSGGEQVGNALEEGVIAGFASTRQRLAGNAYTAVSEAIASAHRAADARSPSRKTMKLGRDLGEGLARGIEQKHPRNRKAGRKAAQSIIQGAAEGSAGIAKVIGRLSDLIKKRTENAKSERNRLKMLRNLDNALVANGKAQDANNAKLADARDKLKEILQTSRDYATSIRDAVVSTGDLTTLGKDEAGTATIGGILDQMRARVQAAQRYADLIATLTKAGLNETSLRQLLAAGVEGGLSTAEALASGGPAAIAQINKLTGQLQATGTGLGDAAADTMYSAGIKAAEGLVKGLESQQKRIDKVARRLANTLANAVRRALRVHSPSRVFEDIGKRTVDGLRIGLDETHVRKSGRALAASLVDGFSDPRLTATAVLDAQAGGSTSAPTVRIELTAAQLDALQRGRGIALDVDAFGAAGGRRVAKVVRR